MKAPSIALILVFSLSEISAFSQVPKPRARDLGIPFDGNTGKYNAITDVAGVEVGFQTLIQGSGKLRTTG
jgi:D-aminopeptidase